ncbi:MAG: hypothetical protein AAF653_18945 [Chloroflexota bacterium]
MTPSSGTQPFEFTLREDLDVLPDGARDHEIDLHTGFATAADGSMYYALPGVGIVRISADMQQQTVISVADVYRAMNFHSTRIATINGEEHLIFTANEHELVVVMTLDGELAFTLARPTLPPYDDPETAYRPTDTLLIGDRLYVADGYAADYISVADVHSKMWEHIFGGHTEDRTENGQFRTAHGLALAPDGKHLIIADRWNSRLQVHALDGTFVASHHLPYNAWLCNLDLIEWQGRWLGVIACLYDVDEEKQRPAPLFVIDAETFEILSIIRTKEDFGVERAQRMHNAVWHVYDGRLYIVCHSWNPGKFMILEQVV